MLKSIQSLRGIFALLIYFHHVEVFPAGGDSGVCFFTVLSGFVLSDGYQNRFRQNSISYGSFLKRRLARIYPLHLLCFIGAFLLTYQMAHNPVTWLVNLLLLQSWSPDPQVHFSANAVSWFLSMILFCYLLFPFIIRFLDRWRRNFYIASSILFAVYFIAIQFVPSGMLNNIIYINPLMRLPDFILGIILWQIIGGKICIRDSIKSQAFIQIRHRAVGTVAVCPDIDHIWRGVAQIRACVVVVACLHGAHKCVCTFQ